MTDEKYRSTESDKQYSVEISTFPNGEAFVRVSFGGDTPIGVERLCEITRIKDIA